MLRLSGSIARRLVPVCSCRGRFGSAPSPATAASRMKEHPAQCASIRAHTLSTSPHSRSPLASSDSNKVNTSSHDVTNHHRRHGSSSREATGFFDKSIFTKPEGFHQATDEALTKAKDVVNDIASMADNPSIAVVDKMDELSDVLCQVADLSECMRLVNPDNRIVEAAQNACLIINNYVEELNTDVRLHRSLDNFLKSGAFSSVDDVTKRTSELFMHDFNVSGIHLEREQREAVVELNRRLLELSHQFVSCASFPTVIPRDQCPPKLLDHFETHDDHVIVNHVPYHSHDSELRALSYRYFFADIPAQKNLLEKMLTLRHELSTLTGYPSFAHRTLKTCMVETPETAQEFLEALSEEILPLAKEEAEELRRFNPSHLGTETLRPWDVTLCTSQAQKTYFSASAAELQDYFPLENTLQGLGNLFHSLFGVRLEKVPTKPGEIWHEDVIKLAFVHEDEGLLGYTYCDLFARAGKTITDCHFTIQGGRELADGSYQTPIITLCCTFHRGSTSDAILLSQHAVENLFHELGHALHSMLGRSKYQNVTGTRCSTDFAEVPSTLMEYFLSDARVLESFARHYETGRPILGSHLSAFQLSGKLFPAFDMQIQIVYALTDLVLHTKQPSLNTPFTEIAADLYEQYAPMEAIPCVAWFLRFNHFYGYGARYYSYLWSRAVSSLIWRQCFDRDPFSSESGSHLRRMLQYGGGLAPRRLVSDMLGFEPTIRDLVGALYSDVREHRQRLKEFISSSNS